MSIFITSMSPEARSMSMLPIIAVESPKREVGVVVGTGVGGGR